MRHTTISPTTRATILLLALGLLAPALAWAALGPTDAGAPERTETRPQEVDAGTAPPDAGLAADGGSAPADGAPAVPSPSPPTPEEPDGAKPIEPGSDRQTGIRGRILDHRTGLPLTKAPVLARGQDEKTRAVLTDEKGAFQLFVPPGTYTLRSYFSLYHGVRMERVRVARGSFTSARLVLDPIDVSQDVAVVEIEIPYRADTTTIAAQDQLRKESRGIGEGMGAQQMSQQGAGDAAAAARRVVGVTIESNQLVIRGLGGRYVKVQLNGLPIPNTDPDFPSVDLDLFPTNVIDNLNVQKVFLPEIPGDFAGGVLDINTVSFPRKFLVSASVGGAYNSRTTFADRLGYRGGSRDWLGFDDGSRALPDVVQGRKLVPSRIGVMSTFPDRAAVEAAGQEFRNTWNFQRTTGLPQMGMNLTVGDAIDLRGRKRFGYLASLVYDYADERLVGVTRPKPGATPTGDAMELSHYDVESGTTSVQLSAIGTASLDLGPDHSLTALTMFNRSMDDQTRFRTGINAVVNTVLPYDSWQFRFLARTIFLNQLLGDHRNLHGTRLRLRWSAFHALGQRAEPDQRVVSYGESGGIDRRWRPTADRLWSDLSQTDLGGTAQLRFPLWSEAWGTVGGRAVFSDRSFQNRRFQMSERGSAMDPTAFTADPETLFGPEGLGTLTTIQETTRLFDSYVSAQRSYAGFLSLETPLVGRLSAAAGARVERFAQEVQSKSPFAAENTPAVLAMYRTERTDTNVLPSAALKYTIGGSMLIRAAYAMTLSRPQVRELAAYDYYDFLRDRRIVGNPELKTATIHNADLRWEWFFGEGQLAAISGFYKRFLDPIELQLISNGDELNSQYQNAKGATNFGGELELRSELERLHRRLQRFSLGGNLSLIRSRIEVVDTGATRSVRRLAGQAPYVINMSLRFAVPEAKLSLGLVYNVVGPRITDVGIRTSDLILPDVEEQAFHSLDFVGSKGLGKHFSLKLKLRNLLLQNRILKQGSLVAQELRPGITVSMGLGYDY